MKRISALILVLALAVNLVACSGSSSTPSGSVGSGGSAPTGNVEPQTAPEATYSQDPAINDEMVAFITAPSNDPNKILIRTNLTYAGFLGEDHSSIAFREWCRYIKEQLGDRVEIQNYWSNTFGNSNDAYLGGLQNRTFEVSQWSTAAYAEHTMAYAPLDAPYLLTSLEDANEKLNGEDSEMAKIFQERCIADAGIRPLYYVVIGMRCVANSKHVVKVPADLKDIKMRMQVNPIHVKLAEAWGTTATTVNFSEVYTALQQGVCDGQENPACHYPAMKFHEVQPYYTETNHMAQCCVLSCSEEWYQELPDDVKAVIDEANRRAAKLGAEAEKEYNDSLTDFLLEQNVEIYTPTDEEMQEWIDTSKTVYSMIDEQCGKEYFDRVLAAGGLSR